MKVLFIIARALMALLFIGSGFGKLAGFEATTKMMAEAGIPLPQAALIAAVILEVAGAALIIIGRYYRIIVPALTGYILVATALFHAPYVADPATGQMQLVQVLKNLAIIGGLGGFLYAKEKTAQTYSDEHE